MLNIVVNGQHFEIKSGISILDACKSLGVLIPRFCYHETLSIAGNCRMCLVEVEGLEKPIASCLTEISENMVIYTDSPFAKRAREGVIEALLLNHPLDCPICDQAGECDLQDQTKMFGSNYSKFFSNKRGVEDKDCGPLIQTIMTRCIHCTRCVRFASEIAGVDFLGTFNRGSATEIGGYSASFFDSEISGNVIDLCPVGALTSKPFAYRARPWELRVNETIDISDSTGSNVYVHFKENEIFRVLPKSNENINGQFIADKARFSYDSRFNNRLKHLFSFKDSVKKDKSFSWTNLFKKLDNADVQNNVSFNINENIGLENINLLKKLGRLNKNINVNALNSNVQNNNLYNWGSTDKISSIDSCDSMGLIFSLNPKVECSIINVRLRVRSQNSLLSFYSMDLHYLSNIATKCINLNLNKSLRIFEGKYFDHAKNFINAESPLVLMSESVKKRGLHLSSITSYLKDYFDSVKVIKINETANTEALSLLNVKNIQKRKYDNSKNIICLNLDDRLDVRNSFFNTNKNVFWFNSHWSKFKTDIKALVPILSEYEEENVYLNLEQRPQKTNKTFTKFFDARSLQKILLSTFENSEIHSTKSIKVNHLDFIHEIVKNPWLFDNLNKNFGFLNSKNVNFFNSINFVSKYPTKYTVTNTYSYGKAMKNSAIMKDSSDYFVSLNHSFK